MSGAWVFYHPPGESITFDDYFGNQLKCLDDATGTSTAEDAIMAASCDPTYGQRPSHDWGWSVLYRNDTYNDADIRNFYFDYHQQEELVGLMKYIVNASGWAALPRRASLLTVGNGTVLSQCTADDLVELEALAATSVDDGAFHYDAFTNLHALQGDTLHSYQYDIFLLCGIDLYYMIAFVVLFFLMFLVFYCTRVWPSWMAYRKKVP